MFQILNPVAIGKIPDIFPGEVNEYTSSAKEALIFSSDHAEYG
jgi:hypothetical protein